MERMHGVQAYGIRLPIISKGDDLPGIIADSLLSSLSAGGVRLEGSDVIGVTEAVVAKAQGNYVGMCDIAGDISQKFPDGELGLVFPIASRNRFMNILKGIAMGAERVYLLMRYPSDEVGNPIMDIEEMDELEDALSAGRPLPAEEFVRITGGYKHPYTGMDYISLYGELAPNISVYVSDDPRDILKLTRNILVCEIHSRERTKTRLLRAGAKTVYTLADICAAKNDACGYNPDYGVLGSNLANDDTLKLFPRDCDAIVSEIRDRIRAVTGVAPEVLVYGDGAFKEPHYGIWELADPVVAPAYTERLGGRPSEIKIKYVADNNFGGLGGEHKKQAIINMIKDKKATGLSSGARESEGTTPRKYADLLGSLCDLVSGSGDKGTPVVLVKGYFDDYSDT